MAGIVERATVNPEVRAAVLTLVADVGGRDLQAQVFAIRDWVDGRLRFVRDPRGVELLSDPTWHLHNITRHGYTQGDCDDAATLSASLAACIGIPTTIRAVGYDRPNAQFAHVYTYVAVPTPGAPGGLSYIDFDTTASNRAVSVTRETVALEIDPGV